MAFEFRMDIKSLYLGANDNGAVGSCSDSKLHDYNCRLEACF